MQIRSSLLSQTSRATAPSAAKPESAESKATPTSDSVSFGSGGDGPLVMGAFGALTGAVGIGGPAALGMGSVKAFMSGHPLLGVGLGAACLATGATIAPISLMGAAMSTDAGGSAGINGYFAGAVGGTVAAGFAIF